MTSGKTGQPWTPREDELLCEMTQARGTLDEISRSLKRSLWSCQKRRARLIRWGVLVKSSEYIQPSAEAAELLARYRSASVTHFLRELPPRVRSGELVLLDLAFAECEPVEFEPVDEESIPDAYAWVSAASVEAGDCFTFDFFERE